MEVSPIQHRGGGTYMPPSPCHILAIFGRSTQPRRSSTRRAAHFLLHTDLEIGHNSTFTETRRFFSCWNKNLMTSKLKEKKIKAYSQNWFAKIKRFSSKFGRARAILLRRIKRCNVFAPDSVVCTFLKTCIFACKCSSHRKFEVKLGNKVRTFLSHQSVITFLLLF